MRQISITENYPVQHNNETLNNTVTTVLNAQVISFNDATRVASVLIPADRPDAVRNILGRVAKSMNEAVRFDMKKNQVIVTGSYEFFSNIMVAKKAAAPEIPEQQTERKKTRRPRKTQAVA